MPLEQTGPDSVGLLGLTFVPGQATPDPSDALMPYLGEDEKLLAAVWDNLRAALEGLLGIGTSQPAWFIDSVNGKDTNTGATPATAVQTFTEVMRRLGPNPLMKQATTITILSSTLLATDQPFIDGMRVPEFDFTIIVRGTVFAGATLGAITSVTAINHAVANGALYVTIGTITWPAARTRVRILGGPRDGAVAYVETANTAAGQSRLSPFTIIAPGTVGDFTVAGGTIVTPINGDVLIVETVSRAQKPLQVIGSAANIVFENMRFDDDAAETFSNADMVGDFWSATYNHCSFGDGAEAERGSQYFNGCDCGELLNATMTPCSALACLITGFFGTGVSGSWNIDADTIFSACNVTGLIGAIAPILVFGNVAFYNNTSQPCIIFFADGAARFRPYRFSDGVTYGTGNQYVFRIRAATGKILIQDIATSITIVGTTAFALIAGKTIATKQLYPVDNKGNLISSPAGDASTEVGANVYRVTNTNIARNVCLTNVANLNAFTVAGNDGVANVEGDTVVLLAQTTPSQNGPYLVGTVAGGTAPLVRPDWWQSGLAIVPGLGIRVTSGTFYRGVTLTAYATTGTVDTNDPVFIPTQITIAVTLTNGTVNITNVPLFLSAKLSCAISRITPNTPAATVMYQPTGIVTGELGSGAPNITIQAQVANAGINAADQSQLNVTIFQG